ncbi:MAG TPA: biotin/lipoyl-binding protein, partial [Acidobacteriota bacterium]|nr:biotin/lipoyl-binding protein [Acidobacteriota bacterium]
MEELEQEVQPDRLDSGPSQATASSRRVFAIIALLGLAFAGLFIYGYRHYLQRQRVVEAAASAAGESVPIVNVERVRRAPATAELILPGNIIPATEAYIYARAAGYVRHRQVDIGDRVREGQLLAQIEAPELDQQVQQA